MNVSHLQQIDWVHDRVFLHIRSAPTAASHPTTTHRICLLQCPRMRPQPYSLPARSSVEGTHICQHHQSPLAHTAQDLQHILVLLVLNFCNGAVRSCHPLARWGEESVHPCGLCRGHIASARATGSLSLSSSTNANRPYCAQKQCPANDCRRQTVRTAEERRTENVSAIQTSSVVFLTQACSRSVMPGTFSLAHFRLEFWRSTVAGSAFLLFSASLMSVLRFVWSLQPWLFCYQISMRGDDG